MPPPGVPGSARLLRRRSKSPSSRSLTARSRPLAFGDAVGSTLQPLRPRENPTPSSKGLSGKVRATAAGVWGLRGGEVWAADGERPRRSDHGPSLEGSGDALRLVRSSSPRCRLGCSEATGLTTPLPPPSDREPFKSDHTLVFIAARMPLLAPTVSRTACRMSFSELLIAPSVAAGLLRVAMAGECSASHRPWLDVSAHASAQAAPCTRGSSLA
mmetsp:Transcript_801/g.1473  ORF Transcript_801/g.1473 Transcript_801/m.1473 type:complete len:214 (-) Transcript_801:4-645(-)